MIKICIFDDNASRRDSLQMLIDSTDGLHIAGNYADCRQLRQNLLNSSPQVVLMDIQMPGLNGIEAVRIIQSDFPHIKVIMQTVFEDDDKIFDAMRFGASGYLLKKTSPDLIIQAIHDVMSGGAPMTPSIAARVLHFFRNKPFPAKISDQKHLLSDREKAILGLLVEGNSYKSIAQKLNISYHTVNSHIKKIYDKLKVHSIGEAIQKTLQQKII